MHGSNKNNNRPIPRKWQRQQRKKDRRNYENFQINQAKPIIDIQLRKLVNALSLAMCMAMGAWIRLEADLKENENIK